MSKFNRLIAYLIYDREWTWLEVVIDLLCTVEISIKPLFNRRFRNLLRTCSLHTDDTLPEVYDIIPQETFYCHDCEFRSISTLAMFFYGEQHCGYCYYIGKGDFNFISPTELLWDGCKECKMYEDIDLEELDETEEI